MNKVFPFVALLGLIALIGAGPLVDGAVMPGTLTNPPFGMVLKMPGTGETAHNPFINLMKTALPWGYNWGDYKGLLDEDHIDIHGQVFSTPRHGLITWVLYQMPPESGATGRYRLTWTGNGTISILGGSNKDYSTPNRILFDYVANGQNEIGIRVDSVIAGPLRNFKLVHQNDWPIANLVFRPSWIDHIRNSRVLRFKEWQYVDNYIGPGEWNQRTRVGSMTYNMDAGAPPELMVDLCNIVGADCYFVMPHNVSNSYMFNFAKMALARLQPNRHVYVEYTNKAWDYNHLQSKYMFAQAKATFNDDSYGAAMSYYGGRAAEMAITWKSVWTGTNRTRLHTVIQVFTDYHEMGDFSLDAPHWVAAGSGRIAPKYHMTDLAVHAILDGGTAYPPDEHIPIIQNWVDTMTPTQFYDRMALACRYGAQSVGGGRTIDREIEHWQYFKRAAATANLTLITYEAGSHIVTPPQKEDDPLWTQLYNGFHASPQWGAVYNDLINAWYNLSGSDSIFLQRQDVAWPGKWHNLGLVRYLGDSTPQSRAFRTQEAARQGTARGPYAFVGSYENV